MNSLRMAACVLAGVALGICLASCLGGCRMVGNQDIVIRLEGGGTVNVGPGPAGNLQEAGKEIGRGAKADISPGGL